MAFRSRISRHLSLTPASPLAFAVISLISADSHWLSLRSSQCVITWFITSSRRSTSYDDSLQWGVVVSAVRDLTMLYDPTIKWSIFDPAHDIGKPPPRRLTGCLVSRQAGRPPTLGEIMQWASESSAPVLVDKLTSPRAILAYFVDASRVLSLSPQCDFCFTEPLLPGYTSYHYGESCPDDLF